MDAVNPKPQVVIGLGNVLMQDEGIGVHLVQALALTPDRYTTFEDMGTGGMQLLHALVGRRKAIVIDCALMNETPGTLRRFTPDQVVSRKYRLTCSSHQADLLQIIELSRLLGECPAQVVIFGIEPARIAPGRRLSQTLTERLDVYRTLVRHEIDGYHTG